MGFKPDGTKWTPNYLCGGLHGIEYGSICGWSKSVLANFLRSFRRVA